TAHIDDASKRIETLCEIAVKMPAAAARAEVFARALAVTCGSIAAHASIARTHAALGDAGAARRAFTAALDEAVTKGEDLPGAIGVFFDFDLHPIALEQARAGQFAEALDTVRRMKTDW